MPSLVFPRLYANLIERLKAGETLYFLDGNLIGGDVVESDAGLYLDYDEDGPEESFLIPAQEVTVIEGMGQGVFRMRSPGPQRTFANENRRTEEEFLVEAFRGILDSCVSRTALRDPSNLALKDIFISAKLLERLQSALASVYALGNYTPDETWMWHCLGEEALVAALNYPESCREFKIAEEIPWIPGPDDLLPDGGEQASPGRW